MVDPNLRTPYVATLASISNAPSTNNISLDIGYVVSRHEAGGGRGHQSAAARWGFSPGWGTQRPLERLLPFVLVAPMTPLQLNECASFDPHDKCGLSKSVLEANDRRKPTPRRAGAGVHTKFPI